MEGITAEAYARHRGMTRRAVQKAIESGRIEIKNGLIDPVAADIAWEKNTQHSYRYAQRAQTTTPSEARRRPAPKRKITDSSELPARSMSVAAAERMDYQARLAKLQFEERSRVLVNTGEVWARAFSEARKARELLGAIPDRLAPMLAAVSDSREIHKMLTVEIRRVCEELSGATEPAPLNEARYVLDRHDASP